MTAKEKTELRKHQILKAAARVFAHKGFNDGTIPDIAREAEVSEASIYEYYSTKENLLFSIPLEPMERLGETIRFHLRLIRGSANKIRAMLYIQLLFYMENRGFAAVLMLILKTNPRFLDTEAHKAIRQHLKVMDRVISDGMESGEFRNDIDPYLLRSSCVGSMEHIVTNWLMLGHPSDEDLLEFVDPMVNTLIQGITNEKPQSFCPLQCIIKKEGACAG